MSPACTGVARISRSGQRSGTADVVGETPGGNGRGGRVERSLGAKAFSPRPELYGVGGSRGVNRKGRGTPHQPDNQPVTSKSCERGAAEAESERPGAGKKIERKVKELRGILALRATIYIDRGARGATLCFGQRKTTRLPMGSPWRSLKQVFPKTGEVRNVQRSGCLRESSTCC